jgi:hypothetical protein
LYSFYVRAEALLQLLRTEKERARFEFGVGYKITKIKTNNYEKFKQQIKKEETLMHP